MTADDVTLSKFLVPVLTYVRFLPLFHLLFGTVTLQTQGSIICMLKVPVLTECTHEMY